MIYIAPVILAHQLGKDNKINVLIRLTEDGKHKYIKLNTRIKIKEWDKKKRCVNKLNPLSSMINASINKERLRIESYILNNPDAPVKKVIENYKNEKQDSFYDFMSKIIIEKSFTDSYGTSNHRWTLLEKFKAVRPTLKFKEVNSDLIKDYQTYYTSKGNSANTINSNLSKFRSYIKLAIKEGHIKYKDDPLLDQKLTQKYTKDKFLTYEEIKQIINLECSGVRKVAKDMYLFSFFCAGMRFSDVAEIKTGYIKSGRLNYNMNKNDKSKDIKLVPEAIEIATRYLRNRPEPAGDNSLLFPVIKNELSGTDEIIKEAGKYLNRYKTNPSIKKPACWVEIKGDKVDLFPYLIRNNLNFDIIKGNNYAIEVVRKTIRGIELKSANSLVNNSLIDIQKELGIDTRISFHTARHSFANYCVKKKIHLKVVQELLGHSKITTTQGYLRGFDQEESDNALDQLFG